MINEINSFFNQYDYDIRKTGNARWIDQKCTPDVVSLIADCILHYVIDDGSTSFTVNDIWEYDYSRKIVDQVFTKPDVLNDSVSNEYDKFFGQPIKLLCYSGVLSEIGYCGRRYLYKVNNMMLLDFISQRDRNALIFLQEYIEHVLSDSGLLQDFFDFFDSQVPTAYNHLKNVFTNFTIQFTPINTSVECGRIFTKVINPLAFKYKKRGTERGRLSRNIITIDMLMYNQPNWRDVLLNKPKNISRQDYLRQIDCPIQISGMQSYKIQKAKNLLRDYNKIRNSLSEVEDIEYKMKVEATQMHHIFPVAYYPDIADSVENLIALTPNQHNVRAHPNNRTFLIDKEFQMVCLLEKIQRIEESYNLDFTIYSFDELVNTLNVGLDTDKFTNVRPMDFESIKTLVLNYFQ